jgi:hypothetical protein
MIVVKVRELGYGGWLRFSPLSGKFFIHFFSFLPDAEE